MTDPLQIQHTSSYQKRFVTDCEVLENNIVAPGFYRMRLHAPEISHNAVPGQFCMIEVTKTLYPFLRRPMCLEKIIPPTFTILYKVEGEGTLLLSQIKPQQLVSVQGPLGNGFPIQKGYHRYFLVSGGIGVAAFPSLAEALVSKLGVRPTVILAAQTKAQLVCFEEFQAYGCEVFCATDDGSAGEKALAPEVLERLKPTTQDIIYACGPMAMMRAVAKIANQANALCYLSLEAHMACGDGACLGCVVQAREEREGERMVRVCVDGPVFDARILDWEAINDEL